jgi:hypothetical protein
MTEDRHIIMAVDPGLATGWAILEVGEDYFNSGITEGGLLGFVSWVTNALAAPHTSFEVVVEKFTIMQSTAKKSRQMDALYLNGFLEGYCFLLGIPFTRHMVSNVKKFAPDAKLKKLGWYRPGAGHDNDAARHLLAYISKKPFGQPTMEKLI